jgi:hypothetical protein
MQWYSYSKNSDFDKLRSVDHRCDVDCGGFEYEYCFAEYEYRVAEYDTNRKTQPLARLYFFRTPFSSLNTNCANSPTSSTNRFSSPGRRHWHQVSLSCHDRFTRSGKGNRDVLRLIVTPLRLPGEEKGLGDEVGEHAQSFASNTNIANHQLCKLRVQDNSSMNFLNRFAI